MNRSWGYIIAGHCICWLIFFSIPAVFVAGQSGVSDILSLLRHSAWLYFISYIIIFYIHTYFLFPKLYFGKKYLLYLLSVLVLATVIFYMRPFDKVAMVRKHTDLPVMENKLETSQPPVSIQVGQPQAGEITATPKPGPSVSHRGKNRPKFDIISTILFILVIAMSVTIVVIKRWRMAVEQAARAEADKANAELAILKAQVNPHFLFNTLNNIYSQAVTHDEKTAESIMKLSNIMRYVTDDGNEDFVPLISETNFITDYIELQRLRLGSKVTLDFAVNGGLENKMIAPMILISFIENIFKYGISNNEPTIISIELRTYKDSIAFYCRNRLFPAKNQIESTGIGIINTKKRLEHLYPGKYSLTIKDDDGYYSVHLTLQS